jgi:peroxiredoxin
MNRKVILVIVAIAVLAGLFLLNRHFAPAPSQAGGAPDFSLTDLQGGKLTLADYRGKVVLLDFWATWCAPCQEEIPHFIDMQQQLGPRGLQVLGISMDDDVKPVRAFYGQHKLNYPVALGDAKLAEKYGGTLGLPVTFVIDRQGRIAKKFVGATDTQVIQQAIEKLL